MKLFLCRRWCPELKPCLNYLFIPLNPKVVYFGFSQYELHAGWLRHRNPSYLCPWNHEWFVEKLRLEAGWVFPLLSSWNRLCGLLSRIFKAGLRLVDFLSILGLGSKGRRSSRFFAICFSRFLFIQLLLQYWWIRLVEAFSFCFKKTPSKE